VQCVRLTDDELWRAIAENTNLMSALIREQLELSGDVGLANDPESRKRMRSNFQTIDKYHREYGELTAELLRRYPTSAEAPTNWDKEHRRGANAG
jgi:hypothetical protein